MKNQQKTEKKNELVVIICGLKEKIEHPLNIKIRYGMSMRCAVFIPSGILSIEWS